MANQSKTGPKRKAGDADPAKPKAPIPTDQELRAINWVSVVGHLKRRKILPRAGGPTPGAAAEVDWEKVITVAEGLEKEATLTVPTRPNGQDAINILNGLSTPSPAP